jgi:hypothetical protein
MSRQTPESITDKLRAWDDQRFYGYTRNQFVISLQKEINRMGELKKAGMSTFKPAFDFTKLTDVFFEIDPVKSDVEIDLGTYIAYLCVIRGQLSDIDVTNSVHRAELIKSIKVLMSITDPQWNIFDETTLPRVVVEGKIARTVLSPSQPPVATLSPRTPRSPRKTPWMNQEAVFLGDFSVNKLWSSTQAAIEKYKARLVEKITLDVDEARKIELRRRMKDARELQTALQSLKIGDEIAQLAQHFIIHMKGSRQIVVDAFNLSDSSFSGKTDEEKKLFCFAKLQEIAPYDVKIVNRLLTNSRVTSHRLFQEPKKESDDHSPPPLSRKDTKQGM